MQIKQNTFYIRTINFISNCTLNNKSKFIIGLSIIIFNRCLSSGKIFLYVFKKAIVITLFENCVNNNCNNYRL